MTNVRTGELRISDKSMTYSEFEIWANKVGITEITRIMGNCLDWKAEE